MTFENALHGLSAFLKFYDEAYDEATMNMITKVKDELMILGFLSFCLTTLIQARMHT